MEGKSFDELAKRLQLPTSRRAALAASLLAFAGSGVEAADKAKRRKKRDRREDGDGPGVEARKKCPRTKTRCGSKCVDILTDERYCGSCSTPCVAGESCRAGACCSKDEVCGAVCCATGQTCVTNACCANSRICGNACCSSSESCVDGACCPLGRVNDNTCLPSQDRVYDSHFGGGGGGAGQMRAPEGVAFGFDGSIWVADTANDRVQQFDEDGNFVQVRTTSPQLAGPGSIAVSPDGTLFIADTDNDRIVRLSGTNRVTWSNLGGSIGALRNPIGVSMASDGSIWVADSGNHRVVHISASGEGLSAIGTQGTGDGKLDGPEDVAVDKDGNVFVADTGNARVQQFNASGTFVRKWGSVGTGIGKFNNPTGIAVGPWEFVYVVDSENDNVQVFSRTGTHVTTFGTDAGLNGPTTISVHRSGRVAIADTGNDRVVVVTLANRSEWGNSTDRECGWGGSGCPTSSSCSGGVCICSDSTSVICSTGCVNLETDPQHCGHCQVTCPDAATCSSGACVCSNGSLTACGASCTDVLTDPVNCGACAAECAAGEVCCGGTCADLRSDALHCGVCDNACASGSVCGAGTCIDVQTDPNNCGAIGAICDPSQTCDFGACRIDGDFYPVARITSLNRPGDPLESPVGVGLLSDGSLLVAERNAGRISIWGYSDSGTWSQTGSFGTEGMGQGQLNVPCAVSVSSNDDVYVVEWGNSRVSVWRNTGSQWVHIESLGIDQLAGPAGIAYSDEGYLFVADTEHFRVVYWHRDSEGRWGTMQLLTASGVHYPAGMSVNSTGEVFLANKGKHVVTTWPTLTGGAVTHLGLLGTSGSSANKFNEPIAVHARGTDTVYVCDFTNGRVSKWRRTSGVWANDGLFGSSSSGAPAGWSMSTPCGIVVNQNGLIFVAERDNNRISIWKQAGY